MNKKINTLFKKYLVLYQLSVNNFFYQISWLRLCNQLLNLEYSGCPRRLEKLEKRLFFKFEQEENWKIYPFYSS